MNLGPYEVWGHFAPMFHLVDVFAVYAITLVGGRHVILPSFTPVDTLLTIGETASIAWRCQHPLGCGWERGVGRRFTCTRVPVPGTVEETVWTARSHHRYSLVPSDPPIHCLTQSASE